VRLIGRLKVLMTCLPQKEGNLTCRIPEGHDFLLGEVAVIIVDLHQGRILRDRSRLQCSHELAGFPGCNSGIIYAGGSPLIQDQD